MPVLDIILLKGHLSYLYFFPRLLKAVLKGVFSSDDSVSLQYLYTYQEWSISMIVLIEKRELVSDGYTAGFQREGVPSIGIVPQEFGSWVTSLSDTDINAVEAFLLGDCEERISYPGLIRSRCRKTPHRTE